HAAVGEPLQARRGDPPAVPEPRSPGYRPHGATVADRQPEPEDGDPSPPPAPAAAGSGDARGHGERAQGGGLARDRAEPRAEQGVRADEVVGVDRAGGERCLFGSPGAAAAPPRRWPRTPPSGQAAAAVAPDPPSGQAARSFAVSQSQRL